MAFINKKKKLYLLFPKLPCPSNANPFSGSNTDPAVNANHQHYRFWLDADNTKSVGLDHGWYYGHVRRLEEIPAWTTSANATSATFDDHEYGSFGGQLKLSPTQPVYRLEQSPNRMARPRWLVGLGSVYTSGSSYGGSLLDVLDANQRFARGLADIPGTTFLQLG